MVSPSATEVAKTKNLMLLHKLSQSPSFLNDCPPDLQARLVDNVRSDEYLTQLKCLQQKVDYQSANILVVDSEKLSWRVWVKDEVEPSNIEEHSGINDENYIVIGEEHVVDGFANFMAKCFLSNPKSRNLSPKEPRKSKHLV
ncbi:hypothetical protein K1719_030489 [Acacia pycnantha]|nr:hypothetical protein K1719_030489 [Acacia pycnantha]